MLKKVIIKRRRWKCHLRRWGGVCPSRRWKGSSPPIRRLQCWCWGGWAGRRRCNTKRVAHVIVYDLVNKTKKINRETTQKLLSDCFAEALLCIVLSPHPVVIRIDSASSFVQIHRRPTSWPRSAVKMSLNMQTSLAVKDGIKGVGVFSPAGFSTVTVEQTSAVQ